MHSDARCEPTIHVIWISTQSGSGHETLGLSRAWKRVEGDPAGTDPEVVLRPPHPPHPSQASRPRLNASTHLCPRWRCPKKTLAPLFISPPGFLSSSSCQLCLVSGQERGKTENGAPRSCWVPLDEESFLSKESFFFSWISSWFWAWTQNNTSVTKTDICSITHVEYCEALFKGSSNNYNDKNSYAEFVHASSKTMETGDKNNGKIWLKKERKKKE